MIQELETFPDITLQEGQGHLGQRRWAIDHDDDLFAFLRIICRGHFPGYPDSIPVQVQTGGFWEGVNIQRDSQSHPRTHETMGVLPTYSKRLVVAHYALHRMTNCWPTKIPKPWHPRGTTLTLRVRGAGQMLMLTPSGTQHALTPLADCVKEWEAITVPVRIVMPVTEYHISCDRMTLAQVNRALKGEGQPDWDMYQGCVNSFTVLGAVRGTMLFDGYEVAETTACDPDEPLRYCLTACLKQRVVLSDSGEQKFSHGWAVGWNHDYINLGGDKAKWGWGLIKIKNAKGGCELRYKERDFRRLFGGDGDQACDASDSGSGTELKDCDLCGSVSGVPESFSSSSSPSSESPSDPTESASSSSQPSSSGSSSSSGLPPCP